ncbi:MAG: amidase [Gemmatimonadaceae bacterium]|nr:amidase [Gemmatimonadaceae bacterium]
MHHRCVLFAMFAAHAASGTTHAQSRPPVTDTRLEVSEASVTSLQDAMTRGQVTAEQLVRAYLARIAAYDHAGPGINALIRINPNAIRDARALDAERRAGKLRGPLHGIPVIIKDNYDTGDMPTSAGSLALATSRPAHDGFLVRRMRDAGAIILAKANMHELAAGITNVSSLGGQTRNPYDPARCPGGSSGGTGAAIAASFATVGWGSDTCGSIRIPSAFGSLFGLRPTQGMVSRTGIVPLSHTQDIGGPLARTATDLAIALDISVGYDSADSVTTVMRDRPLPHFQASLDRNAMRGARIGVFTHYFIDADPEIADSVRAAIAAMKTQGATVVDVTIADFDSLIANSGIINYETRTDLLAYLSHVPNAPVRSLHEIVDRGLFDRFQEQRYRLLDTMHGPGSEAHRKVLVKQSALRARIVQVMDSLSLDALAYPTLKQKPVLVGEAQTGSTCQLSAQTGLPAIAMPAGFSADGLPLSVELLGRAFTDVRLVSLAFAFEQANPRRRAPSTTPALVRGLAPAPVALLLGAAVTTAFSASQFRWDAAHSTLSWSVAVNATAQPGLQAVVLRRVNADSSRMGPSGSSRVISRLLGPGIPTGSGVITLNGFERRALESGRLSIAVYEGDIASPREATLRLPR